jgi:hypothetical protein
MSKNFTRAQKMLSGTLGLVEGLGAGVGFGPATVVDSGVEVDPGAVVDSGVEVGPGAGVGFGPGVGVGSGVGVGPGLIGFVLSCKVLPCVPLAVLAQLLPV